ncbi:UvrD-helicase domain-containing protein, partial [Myxococcus vastator]|uniref:UvrD-helicase domain-containing protein n=1 Tax=Myxococcus vastator TaxID=2709664 RepID=UPI0013D81590
MNTLTRTKGIDNLDDHVDDEIAACLNLKAPRSFFLFAGAGAGKTRSLVTALHYIQKNLAEQLRPQGQQVGVITYTNAACDEIKRRTSFDSLIDVRTIHSFSWSLIEGLNRDICNWLLSKLSDDISQLEFEESKGRKGTKASVARQAKIESKKQRMATLPRIKSFNYSSTGDNRRHDALSHAEVLQITTHFIRTKSAMQHILIGRYPILLIDESQDTNRELLDALFSVQSAFQNKFILGLLGDMMQRIYHEGKEGLGEDLPQDWATPEKVLNHRSPKRIITLINKIRGTAGKQQEPRSTAPDGVVRMFVLSNRHTQKSP